MLVNLADIAAVSIGEAYREQALDIARTVGKLRLDKEIDEKSAKDREETLLKELQCLFEREDSCLGLPFLKMETVLKDWKILIDAIEHPSVRGNRVQLKIRLIEIEKNPARTIHRILRLLHESADTSNAECLIEYMTPTSVEAILVGTLGAHKFQTFCEQIATIVKFDYGLNFFKGILCACIRKEIYDSYSLYYNRENRLIWNKLSDHEKISLKSMNHDVKSRVVSKISILFIKVLEGLITRYEGVLDYLSSNPRRYGFQMRDLTFDHNIRDTIIELLCIKEHKDPIALRWISDDVTIWSMD